MALLAPALVTVFAQINAAFPNRDRSSDGWIGDSAHSSRTSDHNPNAEGYVCAIDIDEDLFPGANLLGIREALKRAKDERNNYFIYERQINGRVEFEDRPYKGINPHDKHLHLSVRQDPKYYMDARAWDLGTLAPPVAPVTKPITIKPNPKNPGVQSWTNQPNGALLGSAAPTDYENLVIDNKFSKLSVGALQILMWARPGSKRRNKRWDGKFEKLSKMDVQDWLKDLGHYDGIIDGRFLGMSVTGLQRFLKAKGFYKGIIEKDHGRIPVWGPMLSGAFQQYLNTQNGR